MADCTCNTDYLIKAAQASISPAEARKAMDDLWAYTSNPFEDGRANQEAKWMRSWREHAKRLVWC